MPDYSHPCTLFVPVSSVDSVVQRYVALVECSSVSLDSVLFDKLKGSREEPAGQAGAATAPVAVVPTESPVGRPRRGDWVQRRPGREAAFSSSRTYCGSVAVFT